MASKVLIYGATGGVGSAVAHQLAQAGYGLHLVARHEEKLGELATALHAGYTCADVADSDSFARVAEEAGETLAGLVYAVGTLQLKSIQRLRAEDFISDFRVNALGAALAVQSALPALKRAPEAAVVLFSSVAARQGFSFHASIGMAKAAIEGLTVSLAAELSPKIRVNAIAPSLVQTPLAQRLLANEHTAASIAAMHPLQRLGQPEDIASLACFLLSPASGWITGQTYGVDGGRSTLRPKG